MFAYTVKLNYSYSFSNPSNLTSVLVSVHTNRRGIDFLSIFFWLSVLVSYEFSLVLLFPVFLSSLLSVISSTPVSRVNFNQL